VEGGWREEGGGRREEGGGRREEGGGRRERSPRAGGMVSIIPVLPTKYGFVRVREAGRSGEIFVTVGHTNRI
jgi:hypothetical protein